MGFQLPSPQLVFSAEFLPPETMFGQVRQLPRGGCEMRAGIQTAAWFTPVCSPEERGEKPMEKKQHLLLTPRGYPKSPWSVSSMGDETPRASQTYTLTLEPTDGTGKMSISPCPCMLGGEACPMSLWKAESCSWEISGSTGFHGWTFRGC